jgi:hypothetical protein
MRAIHPVGRRVGAALLCSLMVAMCLAGPVAAATVTFGTPSGTSQFGREIVFTQPYDGASIKSATILITLPDDPGPTVAVVRNSGSGPLTYAMDTSSGGVDPFVPVVGQFEVLLTDGTTLDGPEIKVTYADDRFTWKTMVGKVVRLHYIDASDSFAQQMLNFADAGLANAAALFGVSETQPLDYYVYPSQSDFQQGLNQPDTVGGTVIQSVRICYATVEPGDRVYAAQVMPHEPTHVAFWDATHNPYHEAPRWLNEGFAQYVSQGYDSESRSIVSQAAQAGTLPSLLALTDYFPLDSARIYLAYAEGLAAADFLVTKYGRADVLKLVQAFGKGDTDDEAFQAALGVDVATFDKAFMADNNATPTKYGPRPEATSPTVPSQKAPAKSGNSALYLLAGIMAVAGVVLLGCALAMVLSSRRQAAR